MTSQRQVTFPITISPDRPYFIDGNQEAFLWQGDTCWRLFWEYSFEEACSYLEDRSERGFSVIQVQLVPTRFDQTNRYGQRPFLLDGDITAINHSYFDYIDKVLAYGRTLGLAFAIAPMWLSAWEQVWHQHFKGEAASLYSTFVAKRFAHFDHILAWIHGGDDDALPLHADISASALIYKTLTPRVANTYHAGIGGGWDLFGHESWFDFGMAYSYDFKECQKQFISFRRQFPTKPILLGETHYEGNDGIGTDLIRQYAYTSLILGGCGQTYGHKDIWMGNMFWDLALCSQASHHIEMAGEIWKQIDWPNMAPDLEGSEIVTIRSKMPKASKDFLAAMLDQHRTEMIAYINDYRWFTTKRKVQDGTWIDPITGKKRPLKWLGDKRGCLQIPGKNACGDLDWLLHVTLGGG